MELWTEIDKIREWALAQVATRSKWGKVEWYPYSNKVNVKFIRDWNVTPPYKGIAYFSEGDLGERESPPYIVLF